MGRGGQQSYSGLRTIPGAAPAAVPPQPGNKQQG